MKFLSHMIMHGKMRDIKNNHIDNLFNEADFLIDRCKTNLKDAEENVEQLKSMRGNYLKNIENMLLFKVKERAYELLNEVKENKLYD